MRSLFTLLFLAVVLSYTACSKDTFNINCGTFQTDLIDRNEDGLRTHINQFTQDLFPDPTPDDSLGHAENLRILVRRIKDQCSSLDADIGCYACIETLPLQSEIVILLDSAGVQVLRIIDITTPEGDKLSYSSVHQ
ncbi:MAG: hypothetical protein R2824_00715 [Saprospiraceae bacterium]|nr:hypothetical protein [Lewinella sp.]